jgi:hypothetical protein
MDRDQQRQNKRSTVSGFSCTAGAELTPLKSPTGRPGIDCEPEPLTPVPFPAVTPDPCPLPPPVPLNLPPGLIVASDQTTAYCPSTAGYSVTGTTAASVTAGEQQQLILFTALENITDNQLNYLFYLFETVPSSSTAIIAAALSGSTSTVVNLTHLNYEQSEELIITIQDAKFTVNTLAVEQARNLLVCQVENNLQSAVCPTSAYFGPTAAVPVGLPYVPSATSATGSVLVTFALLPSTGGQTAFTLLNIPSLTAAAAQANSIALAQAESSLRCVFANAATAAACCTSQAPSNNLGFTHCVPATGPSIPGSATAVGYFSVEADTIFSVVSATEANSVARELSRNALNCYFPSVGTTATCSGTATSVGLTGLGLTGPFAPLSTTTIYLEPGSVILYDLTSSVTAANQQAATLALASLNCFWSNTTQTASCPTSPGFTGINNIYYSLDASITESPNYSSTTQADTVISYLSQADANQQALQSASANISCIYCNDFVASTCTGGVNETVGATSNLICSTLAEVAQNTAISIGNILVSSSGGQLNCCFGNDDVNNTVFCSAGAFRNGDFIKRKNKGEINPSDAFSSEDSFFMPANVITVCYSTTGNTAGPSLFQYSNLYAGTSPQAAACLDTAPCSVTSGSATALPPLWASQTDLFSAISAGATFYSNTARAPYTFNPTYPYIVDRAFTFRNYRTATGGTGFTTGLTAYSCSNYTPYTFRGATLGNYPGSSATLALQDIFCSSSGPTASLITLYSSANNPFVSGNTSAWYSDACGLAAFNPVSSTATAAQYFAGIIEGGFAAYISFSTSGSNVATYQGLYNLSTCSTGPWPDTNTSPTAGGDTYVSYTEPSATGDFKQEANDIAQNIINSFVRCYYLNDYQQSAPCPLGLVTVQVGIVQAGEVVSMISKEVANDTAIDIAEGRRICLNEELIGRPCTETTISNASLAGAGGNILGKGLSLNFSKSLCSFTPTLELTGEFNKTSVKIATATLKKLTICTTGGNQDIYVPNFAGDEADIIDFYVSEDSGVFFVDGFDAATVTA